MVSVITPAFNVADFIGETIESVLRQSHREWEMLIADDGSTDDTIEAAHRASSGDTRVRVIACEHAGLPSTARNRALEHAGGDYIAFLDSDDLWAPEKLERQIASLRANGKRWGFSNMEKFGAETGPRYAAEWRPGAPYFEELLGGNGIPCLTVIVERNLLKSICEEADLGNAFDETPRLKAGEDWDLAIRLAEQAEPDYIPDSLARYRVHVQGISRSFERNYDCATGVIEKHRSRGANPAVIERALDWHNSKLAINRMLHTEHPWRKLLLSSTIRRAGSARNLFFCMLAFLPRALARRLYKRVLEQQSP